MKIVLAMLAACAALTSAAQEMPVKIGTYLQEVAKRYTAANGLPSDDVEDIAIGTDGTVYAKCGDKIVRWNGSWEPAGSTMEVPALGLNRLGDLGIRSAYQTRQVAVKPNSVVAATDRGVISKNKEGNWEPLKLIDDLGRQWAVSDVRGVAYDKDGALWVATPAGVVKHTEDSNEFFTGAEGLPYANFTCAAAGGEGSVWFGTDKGAVRYKNGVWAYRQGPRWLPNDEVRAIAVADDGTAWFATAGGIGQIALKLMTLEEKSAFYTEQLEKIIKRTPFGYTSEVSVGAPGDTSEIIYTDSDNDGLWTAMYGASECYQYAVTKDPAAKERAVRAFEALRHLQKVTQGGEHSPPKGFVARTILPADGPDPNIGRLESDKQEQATSDSLWKIYEPRWPKSADGKWYWKSDTSSDELDGHYFFYPLYYDLVAESPEEKARLVEVVRDLTDHIVTHGFYLIDHDGTPTRWSIYAPEKLNHDPNWFNERGLKSLSILSYLAAAEHITGDPKYGAAAKELIDKHGYLANLMNAKMSLGQGASNQSDDEMAFMSYYNLLKYTKDPVVRENALNSFRRYWLLESNERNPLFHFMYATFAIGQQQVNPWGTWEIGPEGDWLEDSIATLKGFPLDRFNWPLKNSHRLDVVQLPRPQAGEPYEPYQSGRGHLVDGKVLPIENRHFNHWNTDPWRLNYGGNGTNLASGAVFLLPYWMGRYHEFIE